MEHTRPRTPTPVPGDKVISYCTFRQQESLGTQLWCCLTLTQYTIQYIQYIYCKHKLQNYFSSVSSVAEPSVSLYGDVTSCSESSPRGGNHPLRLSLAARWQPFTVSLSYAVKYGGSPLVLSLSPWGTPKQWGCLTVSHTSHCPPDARLTRGLVLQRLGFTLAEDSSVSGYMDTYSLNVCNIDSTPIR